MSIVSKFPNDGNVTSVYARQRYNQTLASATIKLIFKHILQQLVVRHQDNMGRRDAGLPDIILSVFLFKSTVEDGLLIIFSDDKGVFWENSPELISGGVLSQFRAHMYPFLIVSKKSN